MIQWSSMLQWSPPEFGYNVVIQVWVWTIVIVIWQNIFQIYFSQLYSHWANNNLLYWCILCNLHIHEAPELWWKQQHFFINNASVSGKFQKNMSQQPVWSTLVWIMWGEVQIMWQQLWSEFVHFWGCVAGGLDRRGAGFEFGKLSKI